MLFELMPNILFWILQVTIVLTGLFFIIKYAILAALSEFYKRISGNTKLK